MISGFIADVSGILLAFRLRSVDANTGSGNLLLTSLRLLSSAATDG